MDPTALGRYLRESRESKELTLEDAVRALRIRRDILESFEQGEFAVMDSTVRVRGMLRNYAHYLGLDEERVLQYHEAALTNTRRRRRFGRQEKNTQTEPLAPKKITQPSSQWLGQCSGRHKKHHHCRHIGVGYLEIFRHNGISGNRHCTAHRY